MSASTSLLTIRILKGLRKHILSAVGATAILATTLIAIASINAENVRSPTETALIIVSFALLAALFFIIAMYYEITLAKRALAIRLLDREPLEFVLEHIRHILESRTGINSYQTQVYLTGRSDIDLEQATDSYVNDLIYRAKLIFDQITRDNCSVCIKLLSTSASGSYPEVPLLVHTIRDPSSAVERLIDRNETMSVRDNTAFARIVDKETTSGFYYNNHLYRSYLSGDYVNSRAGWFKFYNATAVCAIMNPAPSSDNEILGFLCVDNFKGHFDPRVTPSLMKCLTACLYYVYKNLRLMREAPTSPPVDEEED